MPPVKNDNVLPADFDGVFRFTNNTDEDFVGTWNKIAYTFPPRSTSPMIISGASPEDVQHIRKKFARELAEREFYKSQSFKAMDAKAPAGSGATPAIYSEGDLAPFIQSCLEPLPVARATPQQLPRDQAPYHKEVTQVMDHKDNEANKPLVAGSAPIA